VRTITVNNLKSPIPIEQMAVTINAKDIATMVTKKDALVGRRDRTRKRRIKDLLLIRWILISTREI
jgi:hypothetical protein